ncbi:hypothetical protein GCM10009676_08960 [Prauserella halophila]|uniref:Uncharacterized protein n=1 Tax=Prauserella halophila TaxID=185641 RepID=A0ABP4GLB5_9PSEU
MATTYLLRSSQFTMAASSATLILDNDGRKKLVPEVGLDRCGWVRQVRTAHAAAGTIAGAAAPNRRSLVVSIVNHSETVSRPTPGHPPLTKINSDDYNFCQAPK